MKRTRIKGSTLVLAIASALVVAAMVPSAAVAGKHTCKSTSYDSLHSRNVSCSTAWRVYKTSLRRGGSGRRFRVRGRAWRCHATNRPVYVWHCRARGLRRVRYSWYGGE